MSEESDNVPVEGDVGFLGMDFDNAGVSYAEGIHRVAVEVGIMTLPSAT